jgi:hypothetical protein
VTGILRNALTDTFDAATYVVDRAAAVESDTRSFARDTRDEADGVFNDLRGSARGVAGDARTKATKFVRDTGREGRNYAGEVISDLADLGADARDSATAVAGNARLRAVDSSKDVLASVRESSSRLRAAGQSTDDVTPAADDTFARPRRSSAKP